MGNGPILGHALDSGVRAYCKAYNRVLPGMVGDFAHADCNPSLYQRRQPLDCIIITPYQGVGVSRGRASLSGLHCCIQLQVHSTCAAPRYLITPMLATCCCFRYVGTCSLLKLCYVDRKRLCLAFISLWGGWAVQQLTCKLMGSASER